jgi:uncharacterized protein
MSNSPHPLLFAPIARRLQELGHDVGVTARDNAQTADLTLERWPAAMIIGSESPRARRHKARAMAQRIRTLRRWARSFRADVAVSHNSYGQIVAARTIGLRVVTAMDYEGQPANHLAFRLAHAILMPEVLRDSAVRWQGASNARAQFYAGFKEEIYLADFEPDSSVLSLIGIKRDQRPLVVLRTPPARAAYHRFDNPLFELAIKTLSEKAKVRSVVLVRHPEQRQAIDSLGLPDVVVPDCALDARSLMCQADLVVGAGGTLTREAALLGIPTYTVFAGPRPAVDVRLESLGRMKRLTDPSELESVEPRARNSFPLSELRARATGLVEAFVQAVCRDRNQASRVV